MLRFKIIMPLILFFAMATLAAGIDSTAKNVTVNDFKKEVKANKSIIILDVRMQGELTGPLGKISGSINIPLQELEKRVGELDKYKNKDIYVISRSGIPSKLAAEILRNHGFTAINVLGGMMAYRQSGG